MIFPKQVNQCSKHYCNLPACVSIIAIFIHNIVTHSSSVSFVSILTSRLVLNLKQAGTTHMQHEASIIPSLAPTNSFVGNLGAPFRASNEDGENGELQDLNDNKHELRERSCEGQAAPVAEDA